MGESDDQIILGVTALESFGLEADPVKGTLKERATTPIKKARYPRQKVSGRHGEADEEG
jgi:hypothetical protein